MKKQRPVTLSGVIRSRLAIIESRMFEGVRQKVIVEELTKEGFEVSEKDFRQLLYRARKKRKSAAIPVVYGVTEAQEKPDIEAETKPEKQQQNEPVQAKEISKKMSQQDIHKMLKNDIDLDSL